jgi:hypothetical protein
MRREHRLETGNTRNLQDALALAREFADKALQTLLGVPRAFREQWSQQIPSNTPSTILPESMTAGLTVSCLAIASAASLPSTSSGSKLS